MIAVAAARFTGVPLSVAEAQENTIEFAEK